MARKKLSLGEKIALAASGNQEEEFPEDIEYDTSAKVIELDEDHDAFRAVPRSALRTKNAKLLEEVDERYSGEKVSRKKLEAVEDNGLISGGEEDDLDSDGGSIKSEDDLEVGSSVEEEAENDDSMEEIGSEDDEVDSEVGSGEEEDEEDSDDAESTTPAMQTLSLRDKETEIAKGRATLNQLRIWDSLLEVRIRLQKMLLDCNRLPQTEMYEELISDITSNDEASALPKVIQKSQEATKTLMFELIRLQEIMAEKNAETKKALSSPSNSSSNAADADDPMNEEITSEEDDDEDHPPSTSSKKPISSTRKRTTHDAKTILENAKKMKLEDFQSSAETTFSNFKPYRNQTIQKWNDKTQFAGGKFNRKNSSAQQISTLRQIEQILSNRERLLKRTQIKRSTYSIIGEPPSSSDAIPELDQDPNPEIFDDDDFYHQLLRELIERKTSNMSDPLQLSHHWLELQKLRTKLKRKVDTKASKGRKIRYDVHAKLVNFMAPHEKTTMSTAAVKELFGSLFGKSRQQE